MFVSIYKIFANTIENINLIKLPANLCIVSSQASAFIFWYFANILLQIGPMSPHGRYSHIIGIGKGKWQEKSSNLMKGPSQMGKDPRKSSSQKQ